MSVSMPNSCRTETLMSGVPVVAPIEEEVIRVSSCTYKTRHHSRGSLMLPPDAYAASAELYRLPTGNASKTGESCPNCAFGVHIWRRKLRDNRDYHRQ